VIVKIRKRGDMAGAVRYLISAKAGVERVDPRIVAGLGREGERLDPASVVDVARELDAARLLHGTEVTVPVRDAEKQIVGRQDAHVWTCALALPSADRVLEDGEWREIAEKAMAAVDLGDVRWIAVRHAWIPAGRAGDRGNAPGRQAKRDAALVLRARHSRLHGREPWAG
jgi:hypothetical protein